MCLLWASVSPIYTLMHSIGYTLTWACLTSGRNMRNSTLKRSGGRLTNKIYCFTLTVCSHLSYHSLFYLRSTKECTQINKQRTWVITCGRWLLLLFKQLLGWYFLSVVLISGSRSIIYLLYFPQRWRRGWWFNQTFQLYKCQTVQEEHLFKLQNCQPRVFY